MQQSGWPAEWMRGLLEPCVLGIISRGPTYGYAISADLEASGAGAVKGGTLYPLLSRLESGGLVEVEWRAGEGGPGRKYYTLSAAGRVELARQTGAWAEFAAVTGALMTGTAGAHVHTTEGALR